MVIWLWLMSWSSGKVQKKYISCILSPLVFAVPANPQKSIGQWAVFVLFCFVWLATLGLPVLASRTAARTFRRVVEAP